MVTLSCDLTLRGQRSKCVIFSKFSKCFSSYRLNSTVTWLLHIVQLDTLYKSYGSKNSSGVMGSKGHFHQKCFNSYRLYGIVMWFMHMHQLDILYQSNGSANSLGSFGVTGVKRSFSRKNAITRPLYIARPYDSNMYISLRPSTFVMGLKVNLGSFGVTRVKRSFSLKMQYLLCYVVY